MFCDTFLHCTESSSSILVRPPAKFVRTHKLSSSSHIDVLNSHFASSKGWSITVNIIPNRFLNSVHYPVLFLKKGGGNVSKNGSVSIISWKCWKAPSQLSLLQEVMWREITVSKGHSWVPHLSVFCSEYQTVDEVQKCYNTSGILFINFSSIHTIHPPKPEYSSSLFGKDKDIPVTGRGGP
jgi:hypothetical protein